MIHFGARLLPCGDVRAGIWASQWDLVSDLETHGDTVPGETHFIALIMDTGTEAPGAIVTATMPDSTMGIMEEVIITVLA